ncbi:MFS transporter [Amycolatopsis vancoresmycina]|uniref:Major facilitator superfamily protein n=1 Tax=Amycolatopsis vancoresmycina DSM 44592 TaxID=1292037 RepID=R1HRC6_9PSEU|nr:MFS transporter [Amycolatopsis vancoresmycina]EOD66105.1 major facilitator superfamily protein [Amycolatopsis vancoresmycina DSM 44592]
MLRDRRVAGLLLGDLLASVGTGMLLVAMPVQTLSLHGGLPKAIAIGLVEAAPFVLSTALALAVGLGRVRVPPRTLLVADCVLRSLTFATLGVLAVTGRLTLPVLVAGLFFGATFRLAGSSSRRVLATSAAGDAGRFSVNGLLGLNTTFALYIAGPVLGGVLVATAGAGFALFADACGALVLLACVPRAAGDRDALRETGTPESGWRILRRRPVAARLLVVEFFFNFLYMPVEVALPLYVSGTLHAGASGLGVLWGALGAGAFLGAALVGRLRNLPQRPLLVAIIGLWALCPIALAVTGDLTVALLVFGLGGLVYAPFTPVAYSFLQSGLAPGEQQQVVTLWTTGATVAAPLGLALGGPLIELAGSTGGLVLSGVLTLLLLPIAARAVLGRIPERNPVCASA